MYPIIGPVFWVFETMMQLNKQMVIYNEGTLQWISFFVVL